MSYQPAKHGGTAGWNDPPPMTQKQPSSLIKKYARPVDPSCQNIAPGNQQFYQYGYGNVQSCSNNGPATGQWNAPSNQQFDHAVPVSPAPSNASQPPPHQYQQQHPQHMPPHQYQQPPPLPQQLPPPAQQQQHPFPQQPLHDPMATKDNCLSLNDKKKSGSFDAFVGNHSNNQYSNLNLNQNNPFTNGGISSITSKNVVNHNKNDSNYAYENSMEAAASNDSTLMMLKSDGNSGGLKWKSAKKMLSGGGSAIQNSFEFPRQQDNNDGNTEPEVMQYRTSQRLFNLNQNHRNVEIQQPPPQNEVVQEDNNDDHDPNVENGDVTAAAAVVEDDGGLAATNGENGGVAVSAAVVEPQYMTMQRKRDEKFRGMMDIAEALLRQRNFNDVRHFYHEFNQRCVVAGTFEGKLFYESWKRFVHGVRARFIKNGNTFANADDTRFARIQQRLDPSYCVIPTPPTPNSIQRESAQQQHSANNVQNEIHANDIFQPRNVQSDESQHPPSSVPPTPPPFSPLPSPQQFDHAIPVSPAPSNASQPPPPLQQHPQNMPPQQQQQPHPLPQQLPPPPQQQQQPLLPPPPQQQHQQHHQPPHQPAHDPVNVLNFFQHQNDLIRHQNDLIRDLLTQKVLRQ